MIGFVNDDNIKARRQHILARSKNRRWSKMPKGKQKKKQEGMNKENNKLNRNKRKKNKAGS